MMYKTLEQRLQGREFQDLCIYGFAAVCVGLWVVKIIWGRLAGLHRTSVKAEYDYIVVGSGASGSVMAHRLATRGDKEVSVLLLEAGQDDSCHDMTYYASYAWDLVGTAVDWQYKVTSSFFGERDLSLPSGKVLGGSASMNENIYLRPPQKEFEKLEKLGLKSWSYADCLPFFTKSEKSIVDQNEYHGTSGPLPVGFSASRSPIGHLAADSALECGLQKKYDVNSPTPSVGTSPAQVMVDKKGLRCTPATSFVRPILKQHNFTVRTEASVTKVIFEGEKAVGVEWTDNLGMTKTTTCKAEVILCAGAIGTPAILLRSGVQERNPAVGKNLRDLCTVPMIHQARPGVSFDSNNIHTLMHTMAYRMSGTGPATSHIVDNCMFLDSKVHNVKVSYPTAEDKKKNPPAKKMLENCKSATADHLVCLANRGGFRRKEFAQRKQSVQLGWFQEGITSLITGAQREGLTPDATKGSVTLDDKGAPVIDLSCIEDEKTLQKMLPIVRMTRLITATAPLRKLLTQREAIDTTLLKDTPSEEAGDIIYGKAAARRVRFPKSISAAEIASLEKVHDEMDTDAYLMDYMKAHAQPFGAPVGTCSMAPLKAEGKDLDAAVDEKTFVLKGSSNVRVVDTSILPVPIMVCILFVFWVKRSCICALYVLPIYLYQTTHTFSGTRYRDVADDCRKGC